MKPVKRKEKRLNILRNPFFVKNNVSINSWIEMMDTSLISDLARGELKEGKHLKRLKVALSAYLELCKYKISIFSTLTATTGFVMASNGISESIIILVIGVFLLACGASSLNQYQERLSDTVMERTRMRPIPQGLISAQSALFSSFCILIIGFLVLMLTQNIIIPLLGLFAVMWYNGLYTYLKKKSPFASVPGALVGTIPPAMGWFAGGGSITDYRLAVLCFFIFLWQIPHFWLLMLVFRDDYEKAGLPSLERLFMRRQVMRITSVWILASAVASMIVLFFGVLTTGITYLLMLSLSIWLIGSAFSLLSKEDRAHLLTAFRKINFYMLFVMALLNVGVIFKI